MSELIKIAEWEGERLANVVFVHGLGGHAYDTWRTGNEKDPLEDDSFWPLWVAKDVAGVAVYTLSYRANLTGWLGTAMPLTDRATNIRRLLLLEPDLRKHPTTFICHSLGGLIVKSVLLDLDSRSSNQKSSSALLNQIKQVVFLATPHTGSTKASLLHRLRFFAWPTPITRSLVANDANLRKLNIDYRNFSLNREIGPEHRVFFETLETPAGLIVDETGADPGLSAEPIPIDSNHINIAKPSNNRTLLYKNITDLISSYSTKESEGNAKLETLYLPEIIDDQPSYLLPKIFRLGLIALLLICLYLLSARVIRLSVEGGLSNYSAQDLIKDIRLGTPAARAEAIRLVKVGESAPLDDVLVQIGNGMKEGQGRELCNLMLTAANIQTPKTLTTALQLAGKETEYQLQNPVCTSESNPRFNDVLFSDIAMVRPNFIKADFSRSSFESVTFRDMPDYTGSEDNDCRIVQSDFIGTTLRSSSFSGCALSNVSFNSSELKSVTYHRTTINRVDFNFAQTSDIKFLASTLKHVDFRNLQDYSNIAFALGTTAQHIRLDLDLALQISDWIKGQQPMICVDEATANQCWDLVSEDNPECPELAGPGTFIVSSPSQWEECMSFTESSI